MTNTRTQPDTERQIAAALRTPIRGEAVLVLAPTTDDLAAIVTQLAADDVEVVTAPTARAAASRLHGRQPSAVIVAAELDAGTGYAALESLRADGSITANCPAIAISRQAEPLNRLRALKRGCVDFLALPVFYPELVARLQLALSRTRPQRSVISLPGGLEINQLSQTVRVHGQPVPLSQLEYGLLSTLATMPEQVYTKPELLREVWGYERAARTRTLDSHACRLRVKLRDAGGEYVQNVWGVGYRLLSGREV